MVREISPRISMVGTSVGLVRTKTRKKTLSVSKSRLHYLGRERPAYSTDPLLLQAIANEGFSLTISSRQAREAEEKSRRAPDLTLSVPDLRLGNPFHHIDRRSSYRSRGTGGQGKVCLRYGYCAEDNIYGANQGLECLIVREGCISRIGG